MTSNADVKFLITLMLELIDFGLLDDECARFNTIAEAVGVKV